MSAMARIMMALALVLSACGADDEAFGAEDEQFVETMVELRRAALTAGRDTARFEALRRTVLEEQGVTEEELRAYVAARGEDLNHMATVWDSVAARLSPQPAPQ
jgi:hypothetical protein